jgi:hypothetical protein
MADEDVGFVLAVRKREVELRIKRPCLRFAIPPVDLMSCFVFQIAISMDIFLVKPISYKGWGFLARAIKKAGPVSEPACNTGFQLYRK